MRIITVLMLLYFTIYSQAQDYKFGKVSKEELQEKFNPMDSSANATYLFKERKTFFQYQQREGFALITEIHERIKIYNQEGFNYATKQIVLHENGSNKENISNLKAYTYNIENGKIIDSKLSKDAIFKTEANKYNKTVKFTMPYIKPGSVIEYRYTVNSPFWYNVDAFVFQHDIPIKTLEANFEVPEYFNYRVSTKGFLPIAPIIENTNGVIRFLNKTTSGGNAYNTTQATTSTSSEIDFNRQNSVYHLKNIPALTDEPYVNSINNYRSSAKYELSYTQFPQSIPEYYSTTWKDVVQTIHKNDNFGEQLKKEGYYNDAIDGLIATISDPKQKVNAIFNFVKDQMKWNGYYGYYTNDGVKKAYKDHVGNVAEINLMLISMLRYANLNANPVLVSTRKHGIPLFPTREGYNYVVASVSLPDNSVMLLDATNPHLVPNILPLRALNWQGRLIADSGASVLVDLYPKEKSKNTVFMMAKLNANGDLNGSFRSIKTKHNALAFREKYDETNKDDYLDKLENKYNGIEISDYEVGNNLKLSKPVTESYKFVKESQADIIGDKIYFSPLFFLKTSKNPFKLEKREFPVDFGYPSSTNYRISINIPEGYKVENLPETAAFMMPDELGVFKYNISLQGNMIQLVVDTEINQSIILPSHYEALKIYFSKLVGKEAEQIVLTKK